MTTLKVSSPAELLSAVPFLVGFHPADSLIVVAMHGPRITFAVRIDLPEHDTPEEETQAAVLHLASVVMQQRAEAVTIIGYGEEPRVTPAVQRISKVFRKTSLVIVDELRVEDGRYWSYLCEDRSCCPPEGQPCEPAFSLVATEATYAGAVALPSREALVDQLKPVTGDDREAMKVATARALLRLAALATQLPPAPEAPAADRQDGEPQHPKSPQRKAADLMAATAVATHPGSAELCLSNIIHASLGVTPPVPDELPQPEKTETEPASKGSVVLSDEDHFFALVRSAGRTAVQEAERRYCAGGRLTDDDAAWLGVLLLHTPVRDYAWTRARTREWELAFWSDLTRRLEPRYVPAPASLLAFVAWRMGLGPMANVAVQRALEQKLDYSLANLMQGALIAGLPPSTVDGWPVLEGLPPIDHGLGSDYERGRDVPVHFRPKTVTEPADQDRKEATEPALGGPTLKGRDSSEPTANRPGQLPVRVRSDAAPAEPRRGAGDGPGRRDKRPSKTRRGSRRL